MLRYQDRSCSAIPRPSSCSSWSRKESPEVDQELRGLAELGVSNVELKSAPLNQELHYNTILTPSAVRFLGQLVEEFDEETDVLLLERKLKKVELDESNSLPDFKTDDPESCRHGDWKVSPVPERLQCRHVDLADVSPSNTGHFVTALRSEANGIQVDFDDGHCPSWPNTLRGFYNIYRAVHGQLPGVVRIEDAPVLIMRPRAWNMVEHNVLVHGKEVPGPLFDFGLLMFHFARTLLDANSGPFFYLPKLESSDEADLWDRIFTWTEKQLKLPHGCVKACVLIENVLAAFQMEEILYALRDHVIGLNCGIWDYAASFVNKFGHRPDFVLPDRHKYVSMERHFLKSYMDLVVQTCHKRGCQATSGMLNKLLSTSELHPDYETIRNNLLSTKIPEIQAGVDGFLVYDAKLVQSAQKLFSEMTSAADQRNVVRHVTITANDLLLVPSGSVTLLGLKHNITVGVLFIEAWLRGEGHYCIQGEVEDSATAEISRSQVWQWIRHKASIEDNNEPVTMATVESLTKNVVKELAWSPGKPRQGSSAQSRRRLLLAADMFLEVVSRRDFPEFLTTYLNLHTAFLTSQRLVSEL